jgi:phosphotransferase system HPr (HPr) family protein
MEQVKKLRISNELGLHARAAAKIVALAAQYKSNLFLRKEVKTVGEDSEALMQAISLLFEQKFGEGK